MYIKNRFDPVRKTASTRTGQVRFFSTNPHTNLIQSLLYEIIRVRGIVKNYESKPEKEARAGASILNELVSEAYSSLVNYDIMLMEKYYVLLQNCD